MGGLVLGPLLRHVDRTTATVWVESAAPARVVVDCGTAYGSAATWQVAGHHYALVVVEGLEPGSETAYTVSLDGEGVWPPPESELPPSTIRTLPQDRSAALDITFGSCRWSSPPSGGDDGGTAETAMDPDALDTLARKIIGGDAGARPDALLLLGDQVYADETSQRMQKSLAERRDLSLPPGGQVADFEEYTKLYLESWGDPEIRWLLSTVPSAMIFDDHDVIDDWNTSYAWRRDMADVPWWPKRITGALASYWVYQHLGNLDPRSLEQDGLYEQVRETGRDGDAAGLLHEFAGRADAEADGKGRTRWSYRRDFGRTRLLMIDSRAGRVLTEDSRAMVGDDELAWVAAQIDEGGYDHLLIGSSLPWLLPHGIHDVEAWNEALCAGERGDKTAVLSEKIRRAGDLEHWAAFGESFDALAALLGRVALHGAGGDGPPATISVLSGDVHHAYAAEALWNDPAQGPGHSTGKTAGEHSRVLQFTCSPVHNSVSGGIRLGFMFGWSRAARLIGRALARHARLAPSPVDWTKLGGPWFGNHLMTLTFDGRRADLALDRAAPDRPRPFRKLGPGRVDPAKATLRRRGTVTVREG